MGIGRRGRRQKAEGRRQKAEGRRQKTEDTRQKTEGKTPSFFILHFSFCILRSPWRTVRPRAGAEAVRTRGTCATRSRMFPRGGVLREQSRRPSRGDRR